MSNNEDNSSDANSYSTDASQISLGSKPSISDSLEHVVFDLENAVATIASMVEKSVDIKAEFQTQWANILNSYNKDILTLEKVLDKLPPSLKLLLEQQKREKDRFLQKKHFSDVVSVDQKEDPVTTSQHALNFHLQKDCIENDFQDVFILPPIENIDTTTAVQEDEVRPNRAQNDVNKNGEDEVSEMLLGHPRDNDDGRKRFTARVKMFQKMDEMRKSEEQIAQLLLSSKPLIDCKQYELSGGSIHQSHLTERSREDLMVELDKCTKRNCEKKIALLTSYQSQMVPKKFTSLVSRAELGRMKRLGLNIPCVETMLQEIQGIVEKEENERNVQDDYFDRFNVNAFNSELNIESELIPTGKKYNSLSSNMSAINAMQHVEKSERSDEVRRKHGQRISSSTRRIVQDPHHFLNIEDLPLEVPSHSSLNLKELVQRNTLATTL